jgi:ribonuclease HI
MEISKKLDQVDIPVTMTINEDKTSIFINEYCSDGTYIFVDGAANSHHNASGIGMVVITDCDLVDYVFYKLIELPDGHGGSRIQTNNEAEYIAFITALEYCIERDIRDVTIFSDSKLVVNQINGTFKVSADNLVDLNKKSKELIRKVSGTARHAHREFNYFADYFSKLAIDQVKDSSIKKFNNNYSFSTVSTNIIPTNCLPHVAGIHDTSIA